MIYQAIELGTSMTTPGNKHKHSYILGDICNKYKKGRTSAKNVKLSPTLDIQFMIQFPGNTHKVQKAGPG